ncbi:BrnT family toxin [bacterium]|nr:BrnT family toxin [bacterium]
MRFEWDGRKAWANRAKHGVSFEEAITAFDDPFALVAVDTRHSTPDEERTWLIGAADVAALVVVYTTRDAGEVFRIISARRASRRERKRYEEARGISV